MRACGVGTVLVFKCGARAVVRVRVLAGSARAARGARRDCVGSRAAPRLLLCHALVLSPCVVASCAECFLKVQS